MTKRIRLRTLLIGGLTTLLFVVLVGRLYVLQVVEADAYVAKARKLWSASDKLPPVRGTIKTRDGSVLAMDAPAYTVAVSPKIIHELGLEEQVVNKLHTLLGKPADELLKLVTAKKEDGTFYEQREIRREGWKIDKALADRVEAFADQLRKLTGESNVGIFLMKEQKRYYPKNGMAAQIVGYTDKDGKAITGLEKAYDEDLRGTEGYIKYLKDGKRVQLSNGTVEYKAAMDGKNLTLTLDSEIQHYVETAIKEAYDKYQPKSITAIAADPNTMEILGMANLPSFNPNEYWTMAEGADFNEAIKALYEPGSTFKIVTLAAAVEEGLFNPNETYTSGSIKIPRVPLISDHRRSGWGNITYLEGLKRSSNVAFVHLGYEKLGAEKLMGYIKDFGFGAKTGIELTGEVTGGVAYTYEAEKVTMTFGQGRVQVTPIQQVAAVAAVANGGKLMTPHLVKEVEDPATGKKTVVKPKMVRQVISEATSRKVGEYLEQVVSDQDIGTGKNAYIPGYRVAGKTGTAQKVAEKGGGYADDKWVVSFIGYAPVEDPRIVVYVVLDEPKDENAGGGANAAPVFKKIVQQSLLHMGIPPAAGTEEMQPEHSVKNAPAVETPGLTNKAVAQAKKTLADRALTAHVIGKGATVLKQIPAGGTFVPASSKVVLITEDPGKLKVPNLQGMALRDALEACSIMNVRCVAEGQGFVTAQMEAKLKGEKVIKLTLAPPGTAQGSGTPQDSGGGAEHALPTVIRP